MSIFALLPPEILSGWMHTGPGSGPLMASAAAWDGLAADLAHTVTDVQAVLAGMEESWTGVGSAGAAAGIAPHISWLGSASAYAATMAAQAKAAAAIFETAHAATVPPVVVAANRTLLGVLVGTNFFGQNTPAIMATEGHYEQMWGQNGAMITAYHKASAAIHQAVQPLVSPDSGPAGAQPVAAPDVSGLAQSAAATPNTMSNPLGFLDGILGSAPIQDINAAIGTIQKIPVVGSMVTNPASMASYGSTAMRYLMMIPQLARMGATGGTSLANQATGAANNATGTLMTQIGDFVNSKLQGAVGVLAGHFSSATNAISAKLGQAASMGALKVPAAWSAAADGMVRAAPVLPHTTVSAPVQTMSASSLPGGPFGNAMLGAMAGRGMGAIAAKAPKIVPRSPAGG